MKLKLSLFTTTTVTAGDTTLSPPTTTPSTSPSSSTSSKMTCSDSLQSHTSLQTLPSVPSLQTSLSLLAVSPTLSHSLSSSISLSSPISSLSLSSDLSLLYVSSSHFIHVYQLPSEDEDNKMYATLPLVETFNTNGASHGTVKSVTFCNGKVLTAHQDGKILVWKLTEKNKHRYHHKLISTLPTLTDKLTRFPLPKNHVQVRRHKTRLWVEHNDAVSCLAVTNGKIFSVSWDKTLKVWAPKSLRCQESITAHEDAINAVVVSPDGVVYTGSADGRIRAWGPGTGPGKRHARVATLEKHKSAVNALALNPDGSILFSGACDRSILVWEREDSAKYMVVSGALRGHDGAILCLINVCDLLISGSADRTVRIWRRGYEGKFCCLSVLTGHMKPVKCLAGKMVCDDEISIFSGGLDGEIKVWSVKINFKCHEL